MATTPRINKNESNDWLQIPSLNGKSLLRISPKTFTSKQILQLSQMKEYIEVLERENASKDEERKLLQNYMDGLRKENGDLNFTLKDMQKKLEAFQCDVNALLNDNILFRNQVDYRGMRISELEHFLHQCQDRQHKLKEEMKSKAEQEKVRIELIQNEYNKYINDQRSLHESQMKELKKSKEQIEKQAQYIKKEYENLLKSYAEISKGYKEKEELNKNVEEKLERLKKQLEQNEVQYQAERDELFLVVGEWKNKVATLDQENSLLQLRINNMKDYQQQILNTLDRLKQDLKQQLEKSQALHENVQKLAQQLDQALRRQRKLEEQLLIISSSLEQKKEECSRLEQIVKILQERIKEQQNEKRDLEEKKKKIEYETFEIKKTLQIQKKMSLKIEEQHTGLAKQYENLVQKVQRLLSTLVEKDNVILLANEKLSDATAQLLALKTKARSLEVENEDLKKNVKAFWQRNEDNQKQVQSYTQYVHQQIELLQQQIQNQRLQLKVQKDINHKLRNQVLQNIQRLCSQTQSSKNLLILQIKKEVSQYRTRLAEKQMLIEEMTEKLERNLENSSEQISIEQEFQQEADPNFMTIDRSDSLETQIVK